MKARLKLLPEADREKVLARRKRFLEATDAATAEKKKISLRSVKASSPAAATADRRDEADQREEERERRRERRREERKREDDKERKVAAVAKDGDARRKISQKKGE